MYKYIIIICGASGQKENVSTTYTAVRLHYCSIYLNMRSFTYIYLYI